jgi:hypothetical protein
VFVLACFVGWQVVWNVTPALHTPLMSVTNAISGIIVIGGMLQVSARAPPGGDDPRRAAVLLATINIAGGFLVTQRMLQDVPEVTPVARSRAVSEQPRFRHVHRRQRALHHEPGRPLAQETAGAATCTASSAC